MICYYCGRICDKRDCGLCVECQQAMIKNDQKIKMMTLLKMAAIHCPVKLREQIEGVLSNK